MRTWAIVRIIWGLLGPNPWIRILAFGLITGTGITNVAGIQPYITWYSVAIVALVFVCISLANRQARQQEHSPRIVFDDTEVRRIQILEGEQILAEAEVASVMVRNMPQNAVSEATARDAYAEMEF